MSSYLTFYLQPAQKKAEKPEEPMFLASYSRGSDVYQAFYEELGIAFSGDKKHPYTEITVSDVRFVVKEHREEIVRIKQQIATMQKHLATISNPIVIDERMNRIEELEEYVKELVSAFKELKHIEYLVETVEMNKEYSSFSKVLANIS